MARRKEPLVARAASWASISASFVLSFDTWTAVALIAGWRANLAPALPICVDAYTVTALVIWTWSASPRVARFARWNTYASAGIGVVMQSAYHGVTSWKTAGDVPLVLLSVGVGALPPLFAALAIHLRTLALASVRDSDRTATPTATELRHDSDKTATPTPTELRHDSDTDSDKTATPTPTELRHDSDTSAWRKPATRHLRNGKKPREIAAIIGVSVRTIERHKTELIKAGELSS